MPPELEPIELNESHVASALELMAPLLSGWNTLSAREFWDWKHRQGPWGPSRVVGVVADDKVVALGAFMPWRWQVGDRQISGVQSGDTTTHPEWGRRGLFSAIISKLTALQATEEESWAFGTPNAASLPPYLRLGWESLGPAPQRLQLLRPLKILSGLKRTPAGSSARAAMPAGGLSEADARAAREAPVAAALTDGRLKDLLDRWHHATPAPATLRTVEYLRWRYEMNQWLPYTALIDSRRDGMALLIGRPVHRGALRVFLVCELLATPGAPGARVARGLLRELAALAGADYLSACVYPGSPEAGLLLRSGFLPVGRRGPVIITRSLTRGVDVPPAALHSWRLSFGDLEVL